MAEIAVPEALKNLIPRLPRTFAPALNEQFRNWEMLFPAEQRQLRAQMSWLAGMPQAQFTNLFARLLEIESSMDLPRWDARSSGMSVQDTGLLARSPLYPQWRAEVERVFAKIDDGMQASGAAVDPRLVVCALPPGIRLPVGPLWPDIEKGGTWVRLDQPFGRILPSFAAAVAGRRLAPGIEAIESTWIFECETTLSPLAASTPATVLSWSALAATRREFLNRLNSIARSLKAVDQTNDDLKRLDLARLIGAPLGNKPRIREFVRTLLLSGNGSLVFNNSFVQWGASEALRRVQPQVLIAAFGMRQKLKPFSSTVLFEDQTRSNPVPDAEDAEGSAVDSLMLAGYVHLAAQRVDVYAKRSITLFGAGDLDRVLVAGANAPKLAGKVDAIALAAAAIDWLSPAR
jgi:hypothetical protein